MYEYGIIVDGVYKEMANYSEAMIEMFWLRMHGHVVEFVMVTRHSEVSKG